MDTNNWRPPGEPAMDGGDWRNQLPPESRQRIVYKIMGTLKSHLPFSGQEGLQELKKIALRFEEKIYTAATSQSDYLRKISLKMLTMENKNPMPSTMQSNSANNGQNPPDPGYQSMQSQLNIQPPPLPVPLPSNQMSPEMYNPSSPQSWVANTQQNTINSMDPVEQLVDLYNKIL